MRKIINVHTIQSQLCAKLFEVSNDQFENGHIQSREINQVQGQILLFLKLFVVNSRAFQRKLKLKILFNKNQRFYLLLLCLNYYILKYKNIKIQKYKNIKILKLLTKTIQIFQTFDVCFNQYSNFYLIMANIVLLLNRNSLLKYSWRNKRRKTTFGQILRIINEINSFKNFNKINIYIIFPQKLQYF
ncbi:hypothetical protein pb186bvf_009943 [Paramecium bursaria]